MLPPIHAFLFMILGLFYSPPRLSSRQDNRHKKNRYLSIYSVPYSEYKHQAQTHSPSFHAHRVAQIVTNPVGWGGNAKALMRPIKTGFVGMPFHYFGCEALASRLGWKLWGLWRKSSSLSADSQYLNDPINHDIGLSHHDCPWAIFGEKRDRTTEIWLPSQLSPHNKDSLKCMQLRLLHCYFFPFLCSRPGTTLHSNTLDGTLDPLQHFCQRSHGGDHLVLGFSHFGG